MNRIHFIIISLIFNFVLSCNTPRKVYNYNNCIQLNNQVERQFFKQLNANNIKYSILIFTERFDNDQITIYSDEKLLFSEKLKSDPSLGLAKHYRVVKTSDITITEGGYNFTISKENLVKYKYIYLSKDVYRKKRKFLIKYSNTLCGFM